MIRLANRLGATLNLPVTISFRRVPFSIGVPTVPNAHGDGSVVVGRSRLEPRQFTLSGSIYYPSRQAIRTAADNLLQFLRHPPIEVFKWPGDERRLYAYPQGVPQDWMDAGAELVVDIPMLAPDPYWYGSEVVETQATAGTWSVEVGGNAPTHPIVIFDTLDTGQGLTITNSKNGHIIELDGSISMGDRVVVDTARFESTCESSGDTTPVNDWLNDEFIVLGFVLVPGENTLIYDGPMADVTLTYRPRWY